MGPFLAPFSTYLGNVFYHNHRSCQSLSYCFSQKQRNNILRQNRNSDSMNKSNFDTISHPLLPLPALPKIQKTKTKIKNPSSKQTADLESIWYWFQRIVWDEWRNTNCNLPRNKLRFSNFLKLTCWRMNGEGGNFDAFELSDNLIRMWSLPMYKRLLLQNAIIMLTKENTVSKMLSLIFFRIFHNWCLEFKIVGKKIRPFLIY